MDILTDKLYQELIEFKTVNLKLEKIKLGKLQTNLTFDLFDASKIKYTKPTTKLFLGESIVSFKLRSNSTLISQKLKSSLSNRNPLIIVKKGVQRLPKPPRKIIYEIVQENDHQLNLNILEKWFPFKNRNLGDLFTEKNKERKIILNWGENDKKLKFLYEVYPVYDDYKPIIVRVNDNNVDSNYVMLDINGMHEYSLYFGQLPVYEPDNYFQQKLKKDSNSSLSNSDSSSDSNSSNDSPIFIEFEDNISKQANELLKQHSADLLALDDKSINDLFKSIDSNRNGFVELEDIERVITLINTYLGRKNDLDNVRIVFNRFASLDGRLKFPQFQEFIKLILLPNQPDRR